MCVGKEFGERKHKIAGMIPSVSRAGFDTKMSHAAHQKRRLRFELPRSLTFDRELAVQAAKISNEFLLDFVKVEFTEHAK
jgi:hypothetical protein